MQKRNCEDGAHEAGENVKGGKGETPEEKVEAPSLGTFFWHPRLFVGSRQNSNLFKEAPKEFMYSGTMLVMAASRSGNEALVQGLLDCGAASPHTF